MSEVVISVSGVGKCYRVFENQRSRFMQALYPRLIKGVEEIWALQDINFEIKRGEAVAIIGRNGGGKSTLLEILTGTLTPTAGSVKVNGRVSALLELGSGFNPEYSGRENVILNGLLLGLSREEIVNRFPEIEAFAEIGEAIERPVKTYSSGMMMRLAFAVQVLCDPDILIIDEALSVGDIFFQQKCFSYIRNLCANGATLLFVSHDMGTVQNLCSRGILFNKGHLDFDGDRIHAIQLYLNNDEDIKKKSTEEVVNENHIFLSSTNELSLLKPIWIKPESMNEAFKIKAKLIEVAINDEFGDVVSGVDIGSKIIFRIRYRVYTVEPIHVHVVIKNKYDQIITSVGSLNLKITPPELKIGEDAIFELVTNLSIEAGNYVFSASLAQPDSSLTTGITIDQSPWIGPIHVLWDYSKAIPPFFGAFGMNNGASFVTNRSPLEFSKK